MQGLKIDRVSDLPYQISLDNFLPVVTHLCIMTSNKNFQSP